MRSPYVQIKDFVSSLGVGETSRKLLCPFCEGGNSRETAFSVTRSTKAEAVYHCHRATCGRSGRIAAWGFRLRQEVDNSSGNGTSPKEFTPRVYSGDTAKLDQSWLSELSDRYGITEDEADRAEWRVDLGSTRLVCPIFSPNGIRRGIELRRSKMARDDYGPKTSHYRELPEVWMGWYRKYTTGPVLLVEDVISSLKASRHIQVASLMGSYLSLDHILEVNEIAGDNPVFLALDKDAYDKALKFILKWRFIAPNFLPIQLSKDLKYLSDKQILELIQ